MYTHVRGQIQLFCSHNRQTQRQQLNTCQDPSIHFAQKKKKKRKKIEDREKLPESYDDDDDDGSRDEGEKEWGKIIPECFLLC